jgi:hypothetical protein
MQQNLRRCIEAVQQHFHIRHIARRLTRLGKLLKRDQGCRKGLPNDEIITPVTDPKRAVFEELIARILCRPIRYWARTEVPYLKEASLVLRRFKDFGNATGRARRGF